MMLKSFIDSNEGNEDVFRLVFAFASAFSCHSKERQAMSVFRGGFDTLLTCSSLCDL